MTTGAGAPTGLESLTPRQREVLEMIGRGRSNPEIADALGVTIDGAKWHVREILSKLGVSSREEAAGIWREQRHGRVRRIVLAFGAGKAAVIGTAAVATVGLGGLAAGLLFTSDDGETLADAPTATATLSGLAQKETESARPTATAVPATSECPAESAVCDLALDLLAAVRQGDSGAVLASARPVARQCPETPSVAWQPLCEGGEERAGFFTGMFAKPFQFVSEAGLRDFIDLRLEERPEVIQFATIGCPGSDVRDQDCAESFALVYRIEPQPGAVGSLILMFMRDSSGLAGLVGARYGGPDEGHLRGGAEDMTQEGAPFGGTWYFVPWSP